MKLKQTKRGVVLSEAAMLASVRVSMFNTLVRDVAVSRQLAMEKDAKVGSIKVKKDILDNAFPRTQRAASRIRAALYLFTFPLPKNGGGQQKGPRLLPTKIAEKFLNEVTAAIDDFHHRADEECTVLPRWIESEKIRLGKMFKETDYPTPKQARAQFHAEVSVDGLPTIESINAGAHTAKMQAQADERQSKMVGEIKRELLRRLLEHASHVANECAKEKGKIFPSLLGNVRDLVEEFIPAGNIDDDPELKELAQQARKILRFTDAQIRETPSAREYTASAARNVAEATSKAAKDAGVTRATLSKTCQQKSASYF
jgi:DNA-binding phage protein